MPDCILLAVLACCAAWDVKEHRIPNQLVGLGAILGLGWIFVSAGAGREAVEQGFRWVLVLKSAAGFLGRMALMWVLCFPFFALRMTGAGDIKVMGLITAYLGMGNGIPAIAAGLCLGAVLALGKMLHQGSLCERFLYLSAYIRKMIQTREWEKYYCPKRDGYACVIPLGACYFAGALLMFLWKCI